MRGNQRQMFPVPGGNRHPPAVDDGEVPFGQAEHVEVVAKARAAVKVPEGLGDSTRHAGCRKGIVGHRLGRKPLEDEDVPCRKDVDDSRPTPAPAAARVLWSSLPRSTANRSVAAPGIRTNTGLPSTSTR